MECQTHTNNLPVSSQDVSFNLDTLIIPEIHQFDVGTKFTIEILDQSGEPVDLNGTGTVVNLTFKKPDFNTFTVQGFVEGINLVSYLTQANDLDLVGDWKVQAVVNAVGSWSSTIQEFEVLRNL